MVAAQSELVAAFLKAIRSGPRAYATLAVWNALTPFVRPDTGELLCTQRTLAQVAAVTRSDVYRALARLVEIGALEHLEGGQYRIHPTLMWKGELARREAAEKLARRCGSSIRHERRRTAADRPARDPRQDQPRPAAESDATGLVGRPGLCRS
jgi:hypothetical protein